MDGVARSLDARHPSCLKLCSRAMWAPLPTSCTGAGSRAGCGVFVRAARVCAQGCSGGIPASAALSRTRPTVSLQNLPDRTVSIQNDNLLNSMDISIFELLKKISRGCNKAKAARDALVYATKSLLTTGRVLFRRVGDLFVRRYSAAGLVKKRRASLARLNAPVANWSRRGGERRWSASLFLRRGAGGTR